MFFTIVKYVWIGLMATSLAIQAFLFPNWIDRYKKINWKLMLANAGVILVMVAFGNFLLTKFPKVMGFGIPKIIMLIFPNAPEIASTNINLAGYDIKYLGIVICLLLMTALPKAAEIEEIWFRKGTKNWGDGLIRSLLFGFIHMLVFVPLGAALTLTLAGLFLTYLYFKGGIELSSQGHFQHNLILIVLLLIFAIQNSFF